LWEHETAHVFAPFRIKGLAENICILLSCGLWQWDSLLSGCHILEESVDGITQQWENKKVFKKTRLECGLHAENKNCFWKIRMIEIFLLPNCQLRIYVICVKKWNNWMFLVIRHLSKMCSHKKVMEDWRRNVTVADCPGWFVRK